MAWNAEKVPIKIALHSRIPTTSLWPLSSGLLLICLLAACSPGAPSAREATATREPASDPTPSPRPTQTTAPCSFAGAWSLELSTFGGLAGVHRVLRVDSGGAAELTDRERGLVASSALAAAEVSAIEADLEAACPHLLAAERARPCPDCFHHRLVVRTGSGRFQWRGTSGTEREPSVSQLLSTLQGIIDILQENAEGSHRRMGDLGVGRDGR